MTPHEIQKYHIATCLPQKTFFVKKKMWHECEKSDLEVSHLGPGQTSIMEVYFENSWQLFSKRAPS